MNLVIRVVVSTLVIYLLIVFGVSRFFIPFLGFRKPALPQALLADVVEQIQSMEREASDGGGYLQLAYQFVQSRWHSARFRTLTDLSLAFRTDLEEIWRSPGYAHCTTINYVLYALLASSKFFTSEDVRFRHKLFNLMIHQYLQVNLCGNWVDADPSLGHLPLGRRSGWFG